jgi:hypothetical protein
MNETGPRYGRSALVNLGGRLVAFWVVSVGFGFLLARAFFLMGEEGIDWLRIVELVLLGLANVVMFGVVLRPEAFLGNAKRPGGGNSDLPSA